MELQAFKDDCSPQKNEVFKRLQYWSHQRTAGTSVDTFITELRQKSKECEFGLSENDMLRDKLVFSITDCHLKDRLLQERGLTLHRAIEICRTTEQEKTPLQAMETEHGIQQVPVDGEMKMILPDKNLHHNTRKHLGYHSAPNMDQSITLVLGAFMPKVQLHRLDYVFSERKNVEQLIPEHLHIKEEPETPCEGQEVNQLCRPQETHTAASPEQKPQASQLHWRQQTPINIKEEPSSCTLDELMKRQSVGINSKEPEAARNPDLSSLVLQGPDGTETDSTHTEDSNTYDDDDGWQNPGSDSETNDFALTRIKRKMSDSSKKAIFGCKAGKTQVSSNKIRSESVNSSIACLGGKNATLNEDSKEEGQARAKLFLCDVCHKCFKLKFTLNRHLRVHTGESDLSVRINSKGQEAARKPDLSSLVLHGPDGTETESSHTEDRNMEDDDDSWQNPVSDSETNDFISTSKTQDSRKHSELGCQTTKTQNTSNKVEEKTTFESVTLSEDSKEAGEKLFVCKFCSKRFSRQQSMIQHMEAHTVEKPFRCDVCNKSFTHESVLDVHMRLHTEEKPFACDVCNKCFSRKAHLIMHVRIHKGDKFYRCDVCSKCYKHKCDLKNHMIIHTGENPFVCEICSKGFTQKAYLKLHMTVHTGEKPYRCDVCSKGFSRKNYLHSHMKTHTGEKPYECHVCSSSFGHKSNLNMHMRIHTGEKPFECDVCAKSFTHKFHLTKHTRVHTRGNPSGCVLNDLVET